MTRQDDAMTTEPVVPAAPVSPVDVARLEGLEAKTLHAPWVVSAYNPPGPYRIFAEGAEAALALVQSGELDAEFIAAMRNAAPSLLAAYRAVERVRALCDEAEEIFAWNAVREPAECRIPPLSWQAVKRLRAALGGETE